jgi:hypothetical protein
VVWGRARGQASPAVSRGGGAGSGPDEERGRGRTPELGARGGGRELLPGGPAVLAIEVESGTRRGHRPDGAGASDA